MTTSIQRLPPTYFQLTSSNPSSNLTKSVVSVVSKINHTSAINEPAQAAAHQYFDLKPLFENPGELVEGGLWFGWWALSAYFTADSLYELYQCWSVEHPQQEKFAKIGLAVKNAFTSILTWMSSSLYAASWAVSAQIVNLGQYQSAIKYLSYKSSAVIYAIEGCFDLSQIWIHNQAVLNEQSPAEKEKHQKLMNYSAIRLISNVTMLAWSALGMASLSGAVVSSALMTALLTAGFVIGIAAISYKIQLDKAEEGKNKPSSVNTPPALVANRA